MAAPPLRVLADPAYDAIARPSTRIFPRQPQYGEFDRDNPVAARPHAKAGGVNPADESSTVSGANS